MEKEEEEEEKAAENIRLGKGGGVESEPISDIHVQPDKYRKRDNGTVRQTVRETESWRQRE